MDSWKELLLAKYFSSFGFVVAFLQVPAFVTFTTATGLLRTSERRTFRCDIKDCRQDCLDEYDKLYNSPFPLYGFVLSCFVPLMVVCFAYSWCFVRSRVDEIEAAMKVDPEKPRRRERVKTRRVFWCYYIHLLVRLALGVFFTVSQNLLFYNSDTFYASEFPTEFVCSVCKSSAVNSSNSTINCDSAVGSDYITWARVIWIANILIVLFVFGEICFLSVKALRSKSFTFDSEFCTQHFFNKGRTPATLRDTRSRFRRRVDKVTQYLEPLIPFDGESKDKKALDDIFVDLKIYTGRVKHDFHSALGRHEIYDMYWKPQNCSVCVNKLEELFLPNVDSPDPRKILIVGRPGIGKSTVCMKLSREWANNRDRERFKFLFPVKFRWFNSETSCKLSLKQLLNCVYPEGSIDDEVFQHILDEPEKVLLIFDGLDEFKHHARCLEDVEPQAGNSPAEEMLFSALYVKLMKGDQLSGATVLTTCRPNVEQSVAGLAQYIDRKVEITGFTPEKIHEYVFKFCANNTQMADDIWKHISINPDLLSLCYIPVNCWIVCSILEKWVTIVTDDHGLGSAMPGTTTDVYTGALRLFVFNHSPEFKGQTLTKQYLMGSTNFPSSVEEMLTQLGKLAKEGIEKGELLFESTQVKGLENCGLLHQLPVSEVSPFEYRSQYCFIHLTLQELLAAREIAKMEATELSKFILSNALVPKWHLVIQFVAGLLRGQERYLERANCFVSLLTNLLMESLILGDLVTASKPEILLLLMCLQEFNSETVMKKVTCELGKKFTSTHEMDFSCCDITLTECKAISYFVKHLEKPTELVLHHTKVGDQELPHLCDALKDEHCKLTKLDLSANSVTDEGVSLLCETLKDKHCKLTKLDLSDNSVTDQGVSLLCETLKDKHCKLTKLDLSFNSVTDQGVSLLCETLKGEHCKLTKLDLSGNSVTDEGVSLLSETLKDEHCKLTKLDFSLNSVTHQGVSLFCETLKDEHCKLTKLDLRGYSEALQDVSLLCDVLKDEHCKLTKLDLGHNSVTDKGVSLLCETLKDEHCKVTKLDLSLNSVTDQGVSLLCETLKDEHCKLTKLDLSGNSVTDQGVSLLCETLKDEHCKLTKLDLTANSVTDQGVSLLCETLKDEHCKLTKLDLSLNSVTDQGVSLLCEILKDEHCKLTKLDLALNGVTDEGVSLLCETLKDEHCKLTKLDLGHNRVTHQDVSLLYHALKN